MRTKRPPCARHDRAAVIRHGPLTTRSARAFILGTFTLSWSIGELLVAFPGPDFATWDGTAMSFGRIVAVVALARCG